MRTSELPPPSPLDPRRIIAFWWDLAAEATQALWSTQNLTSACAEGLGRTTLASLFVPWTWPLSMLWWPMPSPTHSPPLDLPRLAHAPTQAQAVPPVPPHVPEPAAPPMPQTTPDPVPPEIDDPPPVEMPVPFHEPPVMPTPMASNVIQLPDGSGSVGGTDDAAA